MEEKIKIEDFRQQIENKEYDKIYNILVDRSIKLAKRIAKIKFVEFDEEENDKLLYTIKFEFDRKFGHFRVVIDLMDSLIDWYCEDEFVYTTEEKKLERCIRAYNWVISDLEQYIKTDKEVKSQGYDNVLEGRKTKLIELFKEMLEYKNKPYDKNWELYQFIDKIMMYYNIYSADLHNVENAIRAHWASFDIEKDYVNLDDVEVIILIDDLYNLMTWKDDGYKEYANYYRDFELEEGQTYSDLYHLEIEKFKNLFKEMLDFVGESYSEEDSHFDALKCKVLEKYPYFEGSLSSLISHNINETYIQQLNHMENVYERLSNEYKNHEENMKNYVPSEEFEDEFIFDE